MIVLASERLLQTQAAVPGGGVQLPRVVGKPCLATVCTSAA